MDDLSLVRTVSAAPVRVPAFAAGSRVLHIGAPKTGSTAIQAAQGRLREQPGSTVTIPGTPLEQARAALAVMGRSTGWARDYQAVPAHYWDRLVRVTRASPGTVFVSSEFLCEADRPTIRRIVDELADADVQVVLTLRPLPGILPSAWQQYLKSGHELPYPRWLRSVLATPPKAAVTPSFWPRHDQGAVVERWAGEVGADRVTVIVLDPDDRDLLLRSFEDLLALPPGALTRMPNARQNRSLTAAEAELFRQFNVAAKRHRLRYDDYAHLIRYGAIMRTVEQDAGADAPKLVTPDWAVRRAVDLGTEYAERIAALRTQGLTVIGDLGRLSQAPEPVEVPAGSGPAEIPVAVAVQALLGVTSRATNGHAFFPDEPQNHPEAAVRGLPGSGRDLTRGLPADQLTFRQLTRVLVKHVRRAVARRLRARGRRRGTES